MTQIILHAATSVLTVAVWTILSGDLEQAAGVTTLYWLVFWALAEVADRREGRKAADRKCPAADQSNAGHRKIIHMKYSMEEMKRQ